MNRSHKTKTVFTILLLATIPFASFAAVAGTWERECELMNTSLNCEIWFNGTLQVDRVSAHTANRDALPVEFTAYLSQDTNRAALLFLIQNLSVERNRLRAVKNGLKAAVEKLTPKHSVGLYQADQFLQPMAPLGSAKIELLKQIEQIESTQQNSDPARLVIDVIRIVGGNEAPRKAVIWLTNKTQLEPAELAQIESTLESEDTRLMIVPVQRSETNTETSEIQAHLTETSSIFQVQLAQGRLSDELAKLAKYADNGGTLQVGLAGLCGTQTVTLNALGSQNQQISPPTDETINLGECPQQPPTQAESSDTGETSQGETQIESEDILPAAADPTPNTSSSNADSSDQTQENDNVVDDNEPSREPPTLSPQENDSPNPVEPSPSGTDIEQSPNEPAEEERSTRTEPIDERNSTSFLYGIITLSAAVVIALITVVVRRRRLLSYSMPNTEAYGRLIEMSPTGSKSHELIKDTVLIGRNLDCDIVLDDESVSGKHALIKRRGDLGATITDTLSTNLLIVNEENVQHAVLVHGDIIRIGETYLRYEIERQRS